MSLLAPALVPELATLDEIRRRLGRSLAQTEDASASPFDGAISPSVNTQMKSYLKSSAIPVLFKSSAIPGLLATAAAAHGGQIFAFQNPIASGSYDNAMFETQALLPGNPGFVASIENVYSDPTDLVTLDVTDFTSTGVQDGPTQHYSARYFLSNSGVYDANDVFEGNKTSGAFATGEGLLTFVNPSDASDILLQISFTKSVLSFGNFAAADVIGFSGRLKTTGEIGNENASFGFPDRYTLLGNDTTARHTATFTSSIGVVSPVPEPASLLAFGAGAAAFIRRRRKA